MTYEHELLNITNDVLENYIDNLYYEYYFAMNIKYKNKINLKILKVFLEWKFTRIYMEKYVLTEMNS